jgi:hypothetical protein
LPLPTAPLKMHNLEPKPRGKGMISNEPALQLMQDGNRFSEYAPIIKTI